MVMISKRYLNEEILLKIYRLFFKVLSRSKSEKDFFMLMEEIFSPTEKVMIAKRIGIIYLLIKKVDHMAINEALKVSTSTITKYAVLFDKKEGRLLNLLKDMILKEKVLGFLDDAFMSLYLQPGIKIGHHKLSWEHKIRQEKRKII